MPPSLPSTKKIVKAVLTDAHWVKHNLSGAFERAHADRQDGFPDRTGEQSEAKKSGISDPTSALALGPGDRVERQQTQLIEHLAKARHHIQQAKNYCVELAGLPQETAQQISDELQRKTRDCQHCNRVVGNTRDDRLVAGRCDTCYRFWSRNGYDRQLKPEKTRMGARMYGSVKPSKLGNK
jgi:ribosomal protein S27AE